MKVTIKEKQIKKERKPFPKPIYWDNSNIIVLAFEEVGNYCHGLVIKGDQTVWTEGHFSKYWDYTTSRDYEGKVTLEFGED